MTMVHSHRAPIHPESAVPGSAVDSVDRAVAHADLQDFPPPSESALPPPAAYLPVGQIIADRYEVSGMLGEGGMGVVYRCRDRGGELVALKRILLPASRAQEHLQWFVAEAEALSGLHHENIVRARDFGQLRDGTPYLVMDVIDGIPLQQATAEALSFPLLWVLTDQLLAALAHAHARGIVHGDLKPTNVLVEADAHGRPRVRLFDFGLAKRRRGRLDPRLGQRSAPSQPPPSAGTPGYMAPEQILGRTGDICDATDLYALGCILYRLLAGRAPFGGQAERETELDLHCYRDPIPLLPVIDVPEGIIDFVMRLLLKSPLQRAGSAAQVRSEWSRFRPEPLAELSGCWGAPCTERTPKRWAADCELEVTRRIGPYAPLAPPSALHRSSRWLPGLLSVRPTPLVGRANLCRQLTEILSAASTSPVPLQQAVVLTGPAGIGKSRLADWLCTDAEEQGTALVLRGCPSSPSDARDALSIALADHFTAAAQFNAGSVPALVRALHDLADGRQILLWLDELTHLSAGAHAFLAALSRSDPSLPILIVTTFRPEAAREPAVADAIGALRASLRTHSVRVPPLESLTMSAMLQAALPMDPALALQIALASNGIPLDALQRLYAFARRGSLG